MWYIILSIIILVCFFVIFRIGSKKIKRIKETKIESSVKEKQARLKERLLELKLEKKFFNLGRAFLNILKKAWIKIQRLIKRIRNKTKPGLKFIQSRTKKRKGTIWDESALQSKLLEAQILFKKGQIDEAEDKLIKILEIDPKNIEVYMTLGEIYSTRGDWETAEEAYRYIVKIKPKFFEGYRKLLDIFRAAKRWNELKEISQEILDLGHNEAWVYVNLGLAFKKTGYPEKAEEYFKRAVELEPQSEELLDYLLEVVIINKNKQLAQKAFNTLAGICRDEIKLQSYRDKIDIL